MAAILTGQTFQNKPPLITALPNSRPHDSGDLCNINVDVKGEEFDVADIASCSRQDRIGRGYTVLAGSDDLKLQPAGIQCGMRAGHAQCGQNDLCESRHTLTG